MFNSFLKSALVLVFLSTVIACEKKKSGSEDESSIVDSAPPSGGNTGQSPQDPPSTGGESGGTTPLPGTDGGTDGNTNNPPSNPSGDDTPPSGSCTPVQGTIPAAQGWINGGATATSSTTIEFGFDDSEFLKMKISDDEQCGCGTWEKYSQTKAWTLKAQNQHVGLSVQFRDFEGHYTECLKLAILHDSLPPTIQIVLDPSNSYETGTSSKLVLSVQDAGTGVQSISCKLNNNPISCTSGDSVLNFQNSQTGVHKFEVTAHDALGATSSESISWTIKNPYQDITQEHEIKSNNKVDILLVDDNSVSMAPEQKSMAQRMSTFLAQLKGLDWRIAITTTDPRSAVDWGDGKLLEMKGLNKNYFISSATDPKKAQKALEDTIQRSESGSGSEQGIYTTYRAIERSLDGSSVNNGSFFRSDADFATVVISDENESATEAKNIPENLLSFVKTTWPAKNFAFHSIIVRPGDTQCKASSTDHAFGTVYDHMSRLTGVGMVGGAIIGSVCENDYGSQLKGIGESVQAMQKVMDLRCEPVGPADSSVVVMLNGSNYTGSYFVQNQRLVFSANLPVGRYTLQYKCRVR